MIERVYSKLNVILYRNISFSSLRRIFLNFCLNFQEIAHNKLFRTTNGQHLGFNRTYLSVFL